MVLFFYRIRVRRYSKFKKTELYRYNKLTLQNNPVRNPRSLPIEFVPEGSNLIYSTELKSERGYFDTRESFLLFTHAFKKKQMEVYYSSIFKSLYWKVLQEEITDVKTVIMVESQNKKSLRFKSKPRITEAKSNFFIRIREAEQSWNQFTSTRNPENIHFSFFFDLIRLYDWNFLFGI
ncbi:hypothetical protein LEP1GSC043_3051 [Leptospira weilii str. Ecochallenge]|uniref:Uncharacterized protein n=1 Tax=Leptospira weilii str. Ecochallenge TaxID=1049986 RepID=N1TZ33_9LEPT|nr:hypothetical protein LEP1GSC043_3051 [Leptospira weilii str. Ecochallenge]